MDRLCVLACKYACRFGVCARCVCVCLCPPGEPLWPDGVSDGTLITQPSKGGCPGQKWVEGWWLCGGRRCCPWGEGVGVRGTCGDLQRMPSDHRGTQPLAQVSDQIKLIVRWHEASSPCATSCLLFPHFCFKPGHISGAASKGRHHFKPVSLLNEQIKKKTIWPIICSGNWSL